MSASLTAAAIALGLPVFPCNAAKQPIIATGFKAATKDREQIRTAFERPGADMIGVPTGAPSGLIAIDVDVKPGHDGRAWLEANIDALPPTRTHKTRSGGTHLIFRAPGDVEIRNSSGRVASGVDVRGEGGYIIVPSSPGYSVQDAVEPADMPRWLIHACLPPERSKPSSTASRPPVRHIGGSAYGLKALADECQTVSGAAFGRQETCLNEAGLKIGALVAGGELEEGPAMSDLRAAGNGMANESGREAWHPGEIDDKLRRAFKDGQQKPRSAPPRQNASAYEPPPQGEDNTQTKPTDTKAIDRVVARFNDKYMVVNENGKAVIFQPGFDPVLKRRQLDRLTFRDLTQLYMNELVFTGLDEKNRPVMKPAGDLWLRHPERRQYIGGVVFDPTTTESKPGILNLWQGFAVTPAPGDWSLMRSHIHAILCCSDPIRFNYLMGWLARMVQRPAEQGEVAVVMKATEGTGKGTLAKALMKILGQHGLAISNAKHLIGNFNSHLRDAILLFADEAFFAGDKQHVGTLKSLITEPYLTVEGKYQNAVQMPNFLHILMASNEDWVIPAGLDARRFFVLEVDEAAKGNHGYFGEIWKQMEAGGYEAMLHDLLAMDLTDFNVRAVPLTDGLQSQKKLSLGTTESWWLDVLERGYVFRSKIGLETDFAIWHSKISTELLFGSYTEFAKSRSERRILTRDQIGRFLTSHGATACRWRNGVTGEHMTDVENLHGGTIRKAEIVRADRVHGYRFGSIADARADFSDTTGLSHDWGEDFPEE